MRCNFLRGGVVNILDYKFNFKLRLLKRCDSVQRLRKKEADVLALLCVKYPQPVLREDFLNEIWHGRYVTPQSIAQVIRSLRLSLGDNDKSMITTIPKLGYQLTVEPIINQEGIDSFIDTLPADVEYSSIDVFVDEGASLKRSSARVGFLLKRVRSTKFIKVILSLIFVGVVCAVYLYSLS